MRAQIKNRLIKRVKRIIIKGFMSFVLSRLKFKKTKEESKEKNKIFMYSAIKIKAKGPEPYSVLNPDTSSDSPSARSNGVRLVSAKIDASHIKKIG